MTRSPQIPDKELLGRLLPKNRPPAISLQKIAASVTPFLSFVCWILVTLVHLRLHTLSHKLGIPRLAPKPLVKFSLRLLSNNEVAARPQPLKSGIAWLARRYRLLLQNISVAASQLSH